MAGSIMTNNDGSSVFRRESSTRSLQQPAKNRPLTVHYNGEEIPKVSDFFSLNVIRLTVDINVEYERSRWDY